MYYEYSVKDGVLHLKGSDNVSLCRGFYDYVKTHRLGMYTWSGNNIRLPEELPAASSVRVESPFRNHYYFNVCTYGYTMPYWDWARWEQEIDWMALHGINMPLALVGYEAILARVWQKTGMTGVLDFYANGHLEALSSSNRGNLVAHGLAPEGIENNEVLYELVTDAGWSDHRMDVRDWLKQYSINRYGKAPAQLMKAWDYLLKSVYGTFTDHPRFNWQFRPGTVKNGSIYMNEDYFRGLEAFLSASEELKDSPYYLTDLCEMTAHYLGGKAEILTRQIDQEYLLGDTLQAHFLQSRFETFMLGMDRILSQHPTLRLDRWVSFASKAARTEAQRKQYEMNARRIVTVWGPPVDDYSARMWSGLIGQYYLGRWKEYYRGREKGEAGMLTWMTALLFIGSIATCFSTVV